MPAETEKPPALEASYKAREVESFLDLFFSRKIGFRLALLFSKLKLTPAQVTWSGAALGIAAGHFYYYRDLRLNLLGMVLHVLSNAFDNADGQLARLTNQGSRSGRALDGLADNLVFLSIYAHLCLRHTAGGGSHLVWLLALAAGASHSLQSAAGDYFRNAYLYFAEGKARAELGVAEQLMRELRDIQARMQKDAVQRPGDVYRNRANTNRRKVIAEADAAGSGCGRHRASARIGYARS